MTGPRAQLRRGRGERGASVLEFALIVSFIIVPLIFGIIQYGYHYWALETAAATAREAARAAVVGTDWDCTAQRAADLAQGPAVGDTAPQVSLTYDTPDGTARVGALATVTVSFDSLDLGFLPIPDGGRVTETGTARVEIVRSRNPLPCRD